MRDVTPDDAALEPIERASRDEIMALQLDRLRWSLRHAYDNVAFYRASFDRAGVHPDDLHGLDDLAKFPVTTKHDLRAGYPLGMLAVPKDQVVRLHASAGTTGLSTVVGYTARDIDTWAGIMARSLRAGGTRPGDVVHVAQDYGLLTNGLGAHYGAARLGCTVVPVSGGQTARQVTLIEDFGAATLMTTPSYALSILDEYVVQGRDPKTSPLAVGLFGGEPWSDGLRRRIEAAFDMHAIDIYGLSEVMGPGLACECIEDKDGLHIWEDHVFPEIIDQATGVPVELGQPGELVLTSLSMEACPIIRYRTGDLTRLRLGTARNMRRLEKIVGRTEDMIILRGVTVFPSQIEAELMVEPALSPHFLIELSHSGSADAMAIIVEPAGHGAGEAAGRLERRISDMIAMDVDVHVRDVGAVPRSDGIAVRVMDKRDRH